MSLPFLSPRATEASIFPLPVARRAIRLLACSVVAIAVLDLVAVPAQPVRAADPALPGAGFEIQVQPADPDRPIRHLRQLYQGEIIDGLVHLEPTTSKHVRSNVDPLKLLDLGHVRAAVFMPTPNEGLDISKEDGTHQKIVLAHNSGGRILAFCGGDYLSNWMARLQDKETGADDLKWHFDRVASDLADRDCAGLGEFGLMHFDKLSFQNVIHIRGNFGPMLRLIDVVAKSGKWLQLHAEPVDSQGKHYEEDVFGTLALWYRLHPELKLVLSHTAMTNTDNARQLLSLYPNLMMSIKLQPGGAWRHLGPVVNHRGRLYADWAKLMEDFPTRFIVGSDAKFDSAKHNSGDKYDELIADFRDVLGSLDSTAAADAIAHGNTRRMYGIQGS